MKKSSIEFRQMQRDRIFEIKPWEKSTGAKTIEGKNISKMNALKSDPMIYTLFKKYALLMKQQKEISNLIR
jgi:hypothetical protein